VLDIDEARSENHKNGVKEEMRVALANDWETGWEDKVWGGKRHALGRHVLKF